MDDQTRREIDKAVVRTLRDAALRDPPFKIEDVLQHLEVHRGFYNLEDPTLLQRLGHKVKKTTTPVCWRGTSGKPLRLAAVRN